MGLPIFEGVEVGWREIADIGLVSLLLWAALTGLRRARARLALAGFLVLFVVWMVAVRLELPLTRSLLQGLAFVLVIVFVVVFQEDLRQLLERAALRLRRRASRLPDTALDIIVRAATHMSSHRVGALVVLPGRMPLERHLEGGVPIGARLSEPLLLSLFDPHSAGHDGAILVDGETVTHFALHLPLSSSDEAHGAGGTRHAAALGLSELTDATCLVVSEERGTISVAHDGELEVLGRGEDAVQGLRARLEALDQAAHPRRSPAVQLLRAGAEWAVALVLAVALWALLVPGSVVMSEVRTADVSVDGIPAGWRLLAVEPPEVQVRLRGARRDFLAVPSTLTLRVLSPERSLIEQGRRSVPLSEELIEPLDGVEVESLDPARVVLRLERVPGPGTAAEPPAEAGPG